LVLEVKDMTTGMSEEEIYCQAGKRVEEDSPDA